MKQTNGFIKLFCYINICYAFYDSKSTLNIYSILGTPYYLSPEQILGKDVTIQSDIYSLGATFYHMVTGEHPFQGTDVYNIIHLH